MTQKQSNLYRSRDGVFVKKWEDREKKGHQQWAEGRLAFVLSLGSQANSHIRKKWNLSLDHRIICGLAIVSRYHALPPYILNYCKLDKRTDLVNMAIVNKLCDGNKDTVLKIVKNGIATKELCQVKNPPRYRGLCFTAGYTMMKAFDLKIEDVNKKLSVKSNY